eukprot:gene8087-7457_t
MTAVIEAEIREPMRAGSRPKRANNSVSVQEAYRGNLPRTERSDQLAAKHITFTPLT